MRVSLNFNLAGSFLEDNMGVAQNLRGRVTQVLAFVSIYLETILGTFF